MRSDQHLKRG